MTYYRLRSRAERREMRSDLLVDYRFIEFDRAPHSHVCVEAVHPNGGSWWRSLCGLVFAPSDRISGRSDTLAEISISELDHGDERDFKALCGTCERIAQEAGA